MSESNKYLQRKLGRRLVEIIDEKALASLEHYPDCWQQHDVCAIVFAACIINPETLKETS